MNWGKVEHALYLSMKSIDRKRADSWRAAFFSSPTLAKRKDQARKSLREAVERSYPGLLDAFDNALNDLQDVQHRRNALSHGLWLPIQRAGEYPDSSIVRKTACHGAIFGFVMGHDLRRLFVSR